MSSVIDILGAFFVGGMLLFLAMSASSVGMQEFYTLNADAITQQNLANTSAIINYDLRKMGFGIPEDDTTLFVAQPNRLKFISQLNSHPTYQMPVSGVSYQDQIADTIEYTVEGADTVSYGNILVTRYQVTRTITVPPTAPQTTRIGEVADNSVFSYYNQAGATTSVLDQIDGIEIQLSAYNADIVLSPELVMQQILEDTGGQSQDLIQKEVRRLLRPAYWKQTRFSSRNLRR